MPELFLHGVIPPVITPLSNAGKVDTEPLRSLLSFLMDGGVHGIFILGTTGEGPSLTVPQRKQVIAASSRMLAGRLPLLVGITDVVADNAIELAQHAAQHNADALVLAPPPYYPLTQQEFLHYLQKLAPQLPLPLLLYNMPSHSHFSMQLETVLQAAKIKNIIGLKDSSGDMFFFQRLKYAFQDSDFRLFVGPEELLGEAVLAGAHGGVSGGANIFPTVYVRMYHAAKEHDFEQIAILQKIIMRIRDRLYSVGHSAAALIQVYKSCLAARGILNSDMLAEPYQHFTQEQAERAFTIYQEIENEL